MSNWNYRLKLKVLSWIDRFEEREREKYPDRQHPEDPETMKRLLKDLGSQLLLSALLTFIIVSVVWYFFFDRR